MNPHGEDTQIVQEITPTLSPAFYLFRPGGWRDYVNLIHWPYTIWHLSYIAIGAGLVSTVDYPLLGWTILAFFLAMGLSAHALDEWRSRPLKTCIPAAVLATIGVLGTAGAVVIGILIGVQATVWVVPCILAGGFFVVAYNLELGPFHNDIVFAISWGAFPLITSYLAQTGGLSVGAIIASVAAAIISFGQRVLSRRARFIRREVKLISGQVLRADGATTRIDTRWLVADEEAALIALSAAMPLLAISLLTG